MEVCIVCSVELNETGSTVGYQCPECGEYMCEDCYDNGDGLCPQCFETVEEIVID